MHWLLRAAVVATVVLAVRSVATWFVEAERERAELMSSAGSLQLNADR